MAANLLSPEAEHLRRILKLAEPVIPKDGLELLRLSEGMRLIVFRRGKLQWQRVDSSGVVIDYAGTTLDGAIRRYGFLPLCEALRGAALSIFRSVLDQAFPGVA